MISSQMEAGLLGIGKIDQVELLKRFDFELTGDKNLVNISLQPKCNQNVTNMASITIKNIPDRLYQKIKESSQQNRRSINGEVIFCLSEKLLGSNSSNTSLDQIRHTRSLTKRHFLTESEISAIKREGLG